MSTVSTFLSRDAILRRQARLNRTRKNGTRPMPTKIPSISTGSLLDIIPEEEFDSTPIAPMSLNASTSTTRSQRRRALNVSPRELRTALDDIAEEVVTFTNLSFNFPLPPLPTPSSLSRSPCKSPPSMSSSLPSSPDSQNACLPLTPSSSDDEFQLPLPTFNPRRASIKPLVINKIHRPSTLPVVDRSEESDSEDSDSEWYTREFSKILSLNPPSQPMSFPAAHRDSIFIAPTCDSPIISSPVSPLERRRRRSSGLRFSALNAPPVPPIPSRFLSVKCTKTLSITAPRRPPPRTSIPDDACSAFSLSLYTDDIAGAEPSPLSMYSQESACTDIREGLEEEIEFPEDFEVQVDCPMMLPLSLPGSPIDLETDIANGLEELRRENAMGELPAPSEEQGLGVGFILEEADDDDDDEQVDLNAEVVTPQIIFTPPAPALPVPPPSLPLPSLPSSPVTTTSPTPPAAPVTPPRPLRSSTISSISSFSFPPSPPTFYQELPVEDVEVRDEDFDERRHGLKSKWSSSTLASVHEEHASSSPKFPGASKLKSYFQGQHKRNTSSISTPLSPKFAKTPMSPSPVKGRAKEKKEKRKSRRESDILIIGFSPKPSYDSYAYHPASPLASPRRSYDRTPISSSPRRSHDLPHTPSPSRPSRNHGYHGVRRSPSQCSASGGSDCGSEASNVSASSTASATGLRRKPIPVEMFLRNGL